MSTNLNKRFRNFPIIDLHCDLLDFIQKKSLKIPVVASHSNYRPVQNLPRNLPDDIAKEIINQNGLIGLNFVHRFVGKTPKLS